MYKSSGNIQERRPVMYTKRELSLETPPKSPTSSSSSSSSSLSSSSSSSSLSGNAYRTFDNSDSPEYPKTIIGKLPPIYYCNPRALSHNPMRIMASYDQNQNHQMVINSSKFENRKTSLPFDLDQSSFESNCSDQQQQPQQQKQLQQQQDDRFTFKIILATVVAVLTNSFPSGYNMGVVNTPQDIFKSFFNETLNGQLTDPGQMVSPTQIEFYWSIAVSLLIVGAIIGSAFTGYLADTFGRRGLLFTNSMIGVAGISMCWIAKFLPNVPMFYGGRLIAGIHTGIASSLVPMYLMEIAPKSLVSCLGSIHVMGLTIGLLTGQIFGLESILGSEPRWHMLFIVNSIFILVGLIFIFMCPESPVYLFVLKKKEEQAIEVLRTIRGRHDLADLADDIDTLKQEQKTKECNNLSFLQLLMQKSGTDGGPSFRRNLLIVCALHAGQQLVGINAIFFYSTMTFKSVGLSGPHSQLGSIGCAFLNALSVLLSIPLVRRFSPRRLLLVSTSGTILCLLLLTISMSFNTKLQWLNFVTIAVILLYVFIFSIGQGPIPYMIGGELFDRASMAIGLSCGCLANWLCNCLVAMTFPTMVLLINQYVFLIFVSFDFLFLLLVIFVVPERVSGSGATTTTTTTTSSSTKYTSDLDLSEGPRKTGSFDTINTTTTDCGSNASLVKY